VKDATFDPKQIKAWWEKWPQANIGVATGAKSGIVVIDVDPRNGGGETLEKLQGDLGQRRNEWKFTSESAARHWTASPMHNSGRRRHLLAMGPHVTGRQVSAPTEPRSSTGIAATPPRRHAGHAR
jgi:hypothetical protein